MFVVPWVPYVALAAGYSWLADSGDSAGDFRTALLVLLGVGLLYSLLGLLSSTIAWRSFAKSKVINAFYLTLKKGDYPDYPYSNGLIEGFLIDVIEDTESSENAIRQAIKVSSYLEMSGLMGFWGGLRIKDAAQAAYEKLKTEKF